MNHEGTSSTPTVRDYLDVVQRRRWRVLVAALIVPLTAVLYSLTQAPSYRASAEVLVTRQNLAASLNGISDTSQNNQPERLPLTQAGLAAVPRVAERVLAALHVRGETPAHFLARSSVTPKNGTDLLVFSVVDQDPRRAMQLANEYARQFTIYRKRLDTAALERARAGVEAQLRALATRQAANPTLLANLVANAQQLRAMEALQTGNTIVARSADSATRVAPKPVRNGILGLGVGLILGVLVAFAGEALDTRVRSVEQLANVLKVPELGRLPYAKRRGRGDSPVVAMISAPNSAEAEAIRVLRTRVELANLERGARTIMVTSPLAGEGKSTTAANLAVAFARAGKSVVLVDLDLHRPVVHRFFGIASSPGLTDVALRHTELADALVPVAVSESDGPAPAGRARARARGLVRVLPSGPTPPVPAEFVDSHAVGEIFDELRASADLVLVDAPSLLGTSLAVTLSQRVDALVLVLRINAVPGRALKTVQRTLESVRASVLGFVAVGVEAESTYYARDDVDDARPLNGHPPSETGTLVALRRLPGVRTAGSKQRQ